MGGPVSRRQGRDSARKSPVVVVLLLIALVWAPVVVHGTEFVVGGNSNWTNPSSANNLNKTFYEDWKAGKTFRVNDVLRFYYNRIAHSVVEVDQDAFNDCNILLKTKSIHKDGDTTVRLDRSGPWYFICGTPGHCSDGQKLSVDVNGSAATASATPSGSFMRSMAASLALATTMAASICIFLFAL